MEIENTRYRQVKRWGNSLVVVLSSVDTHDLGVQETDWMDISDCSFITDKLKKIKEEEQNAKRN